MFPSSGLFADIKCPLSRRGLCERPHCSYRHAAEVTEIPGSPLVESTGVHICNPPSVCGAPVSDEARDDGLQELERINKEIETVRHEVEQEQRRLSRYQITQAHDGRNAVPDFSVSKSAGQRVDRGSSRADFTKTYSRTRNSSAKEQKVKNGQGSKGERDAVPCGLKRPVAQVQLSQTPSSPEPLDDSSEDRVLIIDIPPLPDKKRSRTQKPDCVAGKTQVALEQSELVNTVPVALDSPLLCPANSPCALRVEANSISNHCGVENNHLSSLWENTGCENIPVDGGAIDSTECLEGLGSKSCKIPCQTAEMEVKSPEPASLPASSDQNYQSRDNLGVKEEEKVSQVKLPRSELSCSVENMNPLQPRNCPSKNSLFYKTPAANSGSPCRQAQKTENHNPWSPKQNVPSLVSGSESKIPGQVQYGAIANHTSPVRYQEQAGPASGSNQFKSRDPSQTLVDTHSTNQADSSAEPAEQLLAEAGDEEVIIISSSEEEELNYSDMELSDSDPMEECYRIFMEANNEDRGNEEEQPHVSVGAVDVEKPELTVTPRGLPGKKRVAHEAKHNEQPVAKCRPQPQVLVPLRGPAAPGFGSQSSIITSKIQQVQQRASMMTASVKAGQAFVSLACPRRPETQATACPPAQTLANTQLAPVQNAYVNYLPLGTTVIEVGNNLHFILPEGTFPLPVATSTGPVSSVLTPVSHVHRSTMQQTCLKAAVTPVQRYHTTAPVLIPAPTLKPSPASASAHSGPAASTTSQPAVHAPAVKPLPTRRKLKQQFEASKEKVPHDVRQRYVNMFTEEFLKTTANVNDAFEKAVAEERAVYNRSANKFKYLSVAVNSLKRLKNQSTASAKDENKVSSQRSKGNISLNLERFKGNDDFALYGSLKDYILTEERLIESNYPVQHPEKPRSAALFVDNKKGNTDPLKRMCCRCGATYSVSQTGKHIRKEECNYHYGKGVKNKVPGGVETRYSCCQGVMGTPGCQVFKLHVHDSLSLDGFVSTVPRLPSDANCPGVYSLDCEMCYTVHGLELSRVTVVNSSLQVVYDTFVRPDNEVIDYNTRFSSINEEDVKGNKTSVREVQETLLSFISADTVLIGHCLEADLCALKLLHGTVVDTSVVFPHRLGPPHKLTLNNLTAEYLTRIIQESVCGHDTAEDAAACMELMLWKVKEDGKLKK
ncbi:putative RNA exonuclease 1 -like isoform 2 [Scophthalmus maximus]|uniref:Putative RNA exonuclease 1-like isoform 2 n=1 Tax=Scophthalmus maximus TaxID=52904 RepID=A0A2U9BTF0_SCOMX|nr:RNA exonuclease 1 homolog isoform X2 [Scophthalmus maximus]AWP07465.1 putative RNA exonuclease 1 -like isoform 2 [Scophthalmus maximus]